MGRRSGRCRYPMCYFRFVRLGLLTRLLSFHRRLSFSSILCASISVVRRSFSKGLCLGDDSEPASRDVRRPFCLVVGCVSHCFCFGLAIPGTAIVNQTLAAPGLAPRASILKPSAHSGPARSACARRLSSKKPGHSFPLGLRHLTIAVSHL